MSAGEGERGRRAGETERPLLLSPEQRGMFFLQQMVPDTRYIAKCSTHTYTN